MREPDRIWSIFDLDRTLVRKNASFCFYFYLLKKRQLPYRSIAKAIPLFFRYKRGLLDLRGLHEAVFSLFLKGRFHSLFADAVPSFLDRFLNSLIYRPVFDRFVEAKQKGHSTFLLSSSPDFLVGAIARRLGFDVWRGTEYEVDNEGKLCQILSLIEGAKKLELAKNARAEKTIAYSDSEDDLPLLEWAQKAVIVQPTVRLKRLAEERNWEVL